MSRALSIAAAQMAACLQINRAHRRALEECGETEVVLHLDDVFSPRDRAALAAYDAAVQEILGAVPLPFPIEEAS